MCLISCSHRLYTNGPERRVLLKRFCCQLTLQFLSSAVVSSNSSPSLKEISVFLKVLWVRIATLSPSWLMITVGLVTLPTCRVAKPTPDRGTRGRGFFSHFFQTEKCKTLKKRRLLLTQRFHVLIKVLTVDQFPGGTEGVDHGEGFHGGKVISKSTLSKLQLLQVSPPVLLFRSLSLCVWVGGAMQPIGSGDFLWVFIGYLNWVMVLLTLRREKKKRS